MSLLQSNKVRRIKGWSVSLIVYFVLVAALIEWRGREETENGLNHSKNWIFQGKLKKLIIKAYKYSQKVVISER